MKILVLDNYDSFVYNLVHIIRELGYDVDVYRNDKIALEDVAKYDKILLSPGPGIPSEAGIMLDLIKQYGSEKSIFGVCLGHQAIAETYGAELFNMDEVLHGIGTKIIVKDKDEVLFKTMPDEFEAGRYHSWSVKADTVPDTLVVTAVDETGTIMGIRHKTYDVRGAQFHPESVLTEVGKNMVKSWLEN